MGVGEGVETGGGVIVKFMLILPGEGPDVEVELLL